METWIREKRYKGGPVRSKDARNVGEQTWQRHHRPDNRIAWLLAVMNCKDFSSDVLLSGIGSFIVRFSCDSDGSHYRNQPH